MNKLLNSDLNNCDDINSFAFKTHLDCYLNPGNGAKSICDVWYSKNFVGLWNVYDLVDFLEWKAIKQVIEFLKLFKNSFKNDFKKYF